MLELLLQIAAADALIGKIGYGTVSECLAHATPLVFVRRDYFNEEPFLRRLLQMHNAAVVIIFTSLPDVGGRVARATGLEIGYQGGVLASPHLVWTACTF